MRGFSGKIEHASSECPEFGRTRQPALRAALRARGLARVLDGGRADRGCAGSYPRAPVALSVATDVAPTRVLRVGPSRRAGFVRRRPARAPATGERAGVRVPPRLVP